MTDPMQVLQCALEYEHSGEPEASIPLYQEAIRLFSAEMEKQPTLARQELYFNFILKYIDRIELIKKNLSVKTKKNKPQEVNTIDENASDIYNIIRAPLDLTIPFNEGEVEEDDEENSSCITYSPESANSDRTLSGSDFNELDFLD
ncbi:uncharacterized protein LOC119685055 [Teleopsis dalmanni]|uniref:uncharacterized protein LOC119685055 n=1 Tax=Teleopsis dalmanni TaxID=139649 RepID=UPI0018CD4D23|nr:uncharacterized protein LOC119685055 [Teleopsis dalmanni]XP_037955170.1 uncharacterized protein LOC119685055 [Teleopsis dalmanni]XP_037955171.1 uncharacterized protein LOC119685055 [Teleopsis dalmanni]